MEGVDGVFIGPADLSASMGHVGNPGHPEVHKAIGDAMAVLGRLEKIGLDRDALKRLLPAARDRITAATGRDWLGEAVKTVPGIGSLLGG